MLHVFRAAAVAPPVTLEGCAQGAGCALACDFSNSDEFEAAVIAERRAQGRYAPNHRRERMLACALVVAGACAIVIALVT